MSAVLTVPVLLMAMVPALQVRGWQWLSLALTIPVVTWGAWPFHRAAWTNLRHGTATMDTLISLGVLAAFVFRPCPNRPSIDARSVHLEADVAAPARRDAGKRGAGAAVP